MTIVKMIKPTPGSKKHMVTIGQHPTGKQWRFSLLQQGRVQKKMIEKSNASAKSMLTYNLIQDLLSIIEVSY